MHETPWKALLELVGKPIRIAWAETDSTLRKSVTTELDFEAPVKNVW